MIEVGLEVLSLSQSSASLHKPNMMRNIVAGNWKSNKSINESREWMNEMAEKSSELPSNVRVMVAPPIPYLAAMSEVKPSNVILASQNVSATLSGAYTGEYTAEMLKGCGVEFAFIGHSERREYYADTNEVVVDKISRCIEAELGVVLCCGEPLEVRENQDPVMYVTNQLEESLFHLNSEQLKTCMIAYEPIWAIGTGKVATEEQISQMHTAIRNELKSKYGQEIANEISILYGGSCKPSNAKAIFSCENVDGGLIGGASLDSSSFIELSKCF